MSDQPPNLDKGSPDEPQGPPGPNPYDAPAQNPYQSPHGGQPYSPYQVGPGGVPYGPPPDHPQATTVLILGILGFAVCQVLGIVAWEMGARVKREIDASNGAYGGGSNAHIGMILGIVATCLLAVTAVGVLVFVAIAIGTAASGT